MKKALKTVELSPRSPNVGSLLEMMGRDTLTFSAQDKKRAMAIAVSIERPPALPDLVGSSASILAGLPW